MNKIFWIEEHKLAGRCGPSVEAMDLPALQRAGFHYILSLDQSEHELIRGLEGPESGLIHMPNSIPPTLEEAQLFEHLLPEAVDQVVERVARNAGAVLVHCHAGCDRTGGTLSGYLRRTRGYNAAEALAHVRKANPKAISAPGYETMLLAIIDKLEPQTGSE